MAVAPLAETGAVVERAAQKEAARVAYEQRLLELLLLTDSLLDEVERTNLRNEETITPRVGAAIVRVECEIGFDAAAAPASTVLALERIYDIQDRLFRLRQPWYWTSQRPRDGADEADDDS